MATPIGLIWNLILSYSLISLRLIEARESQFALDGIW